MMRIGHGYDVHRFEKGRKCIIGGVTIPFDKGLAGHSDADVLLHAIADALLGAAAQNKAEWDEKALLRLKRILKMDDCRAAAELSACANRAKTRLKKSAALLAMR